jgi:hypothetical protein
MTKPSDNYGEFKGSTMTRLESLSGDINELKTVIHDLQRSVEDLKSFKAWTLGMGAAAGFLAGILKDFIKVKA